MKFGPGMALQAAALAFVIVLGAALRNEANAENARVRTQCAIVRECLGQQQDPRLRWSATRLAEGIRKGEFTSEEICALFIAQASKLNPYMNALAATRFQAALEDARRADARIRASPHDSKLPPFLGVPYFSKECIAHPDLPWTCGVVSRAHMTRAPFAATAHVLLERNGLILLGVGNVPELCVHVDTFNNVYGATRNPYNLARSVGGSSGGTAGAVAALFAPVGLASDMGGSGRIPACYTGIFGHKPSGGLVSLHGSIPTERASLGFFCQLGPFARHAEDLLPLVAALCKDAHVEWNATVDVAQLRVVHVRQQPGTRSTLLRVFAQQPSARALRAQDKVVDHLKRLGCAVVADARFHLLDEAFDVFTSSLTHDLRDYPLRRELAQAGQGSHYAGSRLWSIVEWVKCCATLGMGTQFSWPALSGAAMANLLDVMPGQARLRTRVREALRVQLEEAMGPRGVLVVPGMPTAAPALGSVLFALRTSEIGTYAVFNVLGFCATQVPLGLDDDGMPFGVQIVSRHGNDHLCTAVACELQRAGVAGWQQPA